MSDTVTGPRSRRDPAATRQRWVERLERFRSSEQTIAAFWAAEGIAVPTFSLRKRTLAAENAASDRPPSLVPLRIAAASPAIELVLPGGAVLRFAAGTDTTLIVALARQLGVVSC